MYMYKNYYNGVGAAFTCTLDVKVSRLLYM